ncbi:uncharacterized protein MEPE_01555 [Melanopsichium pennsylvanicum]|uniref:Uncharacterized protein n=2 Tax=Melanopsichium pennsylvanicum TaxID=63383 RepID=A0AAJ4XI76_9BASI|nr:putative protein [Melanopsichium pennsylvanicum 4]SNX82849.1 uncharacterized protein MEPE_01555 [Melanopsichium pennsylvanicum]
MASLSSSPSRHSGLLACPAARGFSEMFGLFFDHKDRSEDGHHHLTASDSDSAPTSHQVYPWASAAATPLSTPPSSVAHGDLSPESHRTPKKKRLSWLGSTTASHWHSHLASTSSSTEAFSSCPIRRTQFHSRTSSWNSSSACSKEHTAKTEEGSGKSKKPVDRNAGAASLVPNAQFLGLMLLMILLISSALIKVLSVLLFLTIFALDDV